MAWSLGGGLLGSLSEPEAGPSIEQERGVGRRSGVEGNGGGTWALMAASVEYRGRLGKGI